MRKKYFYSGYAYTKKAIITFFLSDTKLKYLCVLLYKIVKTHFPVCSLILIN